MQTTHSHACRVLVTSGPTRAWIDKVRYIANTSSGMLGARIVDALLKLEVPVIHLYGAESQQPRSSGHILLQSIPVTTMEDLIESVRHVASRGDVIGIIHAMAVLDYVPEKQFGGKTPSDADHWDLRLVKTPKVAGIMRELMPDAIMVGFKLEAGVADNELIGRAARILDRYHLDLVVANDIDKVGQDLHEALLVLPDRSVLTRAHTKNEIAEAVAGFMVRNIEERTKKM
jgi:phosphopantothenoylcysteine synthetase/decarboxylase